MLSSYWYITMTGSRFWWLRWLMILIYSQQSKYAHVQISLQQMKRWKPNSCHPLLYKCPSQKCHNNPKTEEKMTNAGRVSGAQCARLLSWDLSGRIENPEVNPAIREQSGWSHHCLWKWQQRTGEAQQSGTCRDPGRQSLLDSTLQEADQPVTLCCRC